MVRATASASVKGVMDQLGMIAGPPLLGAPKACIPASTPGAVCTATCNAQANFTVPPTCTTTADSHMHQAVCNRGKAVAAGSLKIEFSAATNVLSKTGCENEGHYGAVMARCQVDLSTTPLGAGACIDIDVTNVMSVSPAAVAGVTCQKVGALAFNRRTAVQVNAGNGACGGTLAECNNKNNWGGGEWQGTQYPSCPGAGGSPAPYTQQYTMSCPVGTRQWNTLSYSVTTPGASDVKFAVQTAATAAGPWSPATVGPPAGVVVADAPLDHPDTCSMTGPSPCGGTYPASCKCPYQSLDLALEGRAREPGAQPEHPLHPGLRCSPDFHQLRGRLRRLASWLQQEGCLRRWKQHGDHDGLRELERVHQQPEPLLEVGRVPVRLPLRRVVRQRQVRAECNR